VVLGLFRDQFRLEDVSGVIKPDDGGTDDGGTADGSTDPGSADDSGALAGLAPAQRRMWQQGAGQHPVGRDDRERAAGHAV